MPVCQKTGISRQVDDLIQLELEPLPLRCKLNVRNGLGVVCFVEMKQICAENLSGAVPHRSHVLCVD